MHIWTGDAWFEALTDTEADILKEIWKKKRLTPKRLTFGEVSIYVELSEKISEYRNRVQVERARLRKAK